MLESAITTFTISTDAISFVAALAILGFAVALAITPIYTTLAYKHKWWKRLRSEAFNGEKAVEFDKLHGAKHLRNIPTMAGIVMVVAITIVTVIFNLFPQELFRQTILPLVALIGAGAVGLLDDVINLKNLGGIAGLKSRIKLSMILLVAVLGGLYFVFKLDYDTVYIPFLQLDLTISGLGILALFTLVVVSTANAVNITDGLDGLAGGLLTSAFAAYAVIALLQGNIGLAGFCATTVGVLLAYTWFNIFPARFFMGDVGSFALGAALGVVAMLTDTVFALPIIGGVFVLEAGSSLLQIVSKKLFKRKVFRVAPLHHHFEAGGWPETKVTMRFWVVGQVAAMLGVITVILGGLPG